MSFSFEPLAEFTIYLEPRGLLPLGALDAHPIKSLLLETVSPDKCLNAMSTT